jgi:cytochrome c oxidase subunit 1
MGGLNYVVTVLQARTAGMTHDAAAADGVGHLHGHHPGAAGFPALFVSAIMMLLDQTLGTSFFMPRWSPRAAAGYSGGNPLLFQHLFWFFGHPRSTSWRCRPSASSPT